MIIVYSTQPGNIAADRVGGGKNSPFTSSLVEALQSRDLSLGSALLGGCWYENYLNLDLLDFKDFLD